MSRRIGRVVLAVTLLLGLVVAAISLNVLLLSRAAAANDPVGHLSPGTRIPPPAPRWTLRPARGRIEHRGADD